MRSGITSGGRRTAPRVHWLLAALATAGLGVAGCSSPESEKAAEKSAEKPAPAEVSKTISDKVTVTSIDKEKRLLSLKDKDGKMMTVQAGPEVRNFDQIQLGNVVVVRYLVSLAVALVKPGENPPPLSGTVAAGTAEKGAKPAAAVGGQITATVRIESVDLKKNLVVFTAPDGGLRAVNVERPEGIKFIQGLKPGDQVQITYTEALAISVEKQ